MALPSSGPISMLQIAAEFGGAVPHSLTEYYGVAPGIPASGTISFAHFYGKSNAFTYTLSANTAQPDIRALAAAAGWNGTAPLIVNVTAALINSWDLGSTAFPGGILINISAATRIGGVRGQGASAGNGGAGTFAFKTRVPVSIDCSGTMSGGGGGAASGGSCWVRYQTTSQTNTGQGGAGGGGQGFQDVNSLTVLANASGSSGTSSTYSGSVLGGQTKPYATGGHGGSGAAWGVMGGMGNLGSIGGSYAESYVAPQPSGGAAGPAVDGDSFVAWGNKGTLLGGLVN